MKRTTIVKPMRQDRVMLATATRRSVVASSEVNVDDLTSLLEALEQCKSVMDRMDDDTFELAEKCLGTSAYNNIVNAIDTLPEAWKE